MALPIETTVAAPDETMFRIWTRDSVVHVDCSVTLDGDTEYDENNEYHVKYHRKNFHPEGDYETYHNDIETKIGNGEDIVEEVPEEDPEGE